MTTTFQRSRWSTLCLSAFMAAALAACGGDDNNNNGNPGGGDDLGISEEGCQDECKQFLAKLVDDFAAAPAAAAAAKATATAAAYRVNGDEIEFDVASTPLDDDHPGDLSLAFPVSNSELAYLLRVNKVTGEITIDNKNDGVYTLKAFDEASYYQEIDYAETDLAERNKAHYAYVSFNPQEVENEIDKLASLRRQWKKVDGSDYPLPGVSILISKHWEDCPGQQSSCDLVMLTTNPEAMSDDDDNGGDNGDTGGTGEVPAALGGDKGVTGTISGTQQKATAVASATNGPGGVIAIMAMPMGLGPKWDMVVQPQLGAQTCNTTAGVFVEYSVLGGIDAWTSANNKGTCSINVSILTATEVAGTFTATLGAGDSNVDKTSRTVTNGAFHLTR